MCPPDGDLLTAWVCWLGGRLDEECMVLGLSVVNLGRMGKILQAVGALTVLAEIIGTGPLRAMGKLLFEFIPTKQVKAAWVSALSYLKFAFFYSYSPKGQKAARLSNIGLSRLHTLVWVGAIFAGPYFTYIFGGRGLDLILFGILSISIFGSYILPFFIALCIAVLALAVIFTSSVAGFFGLIFIKPMAWLLDHEAIQSRAKTTGVLLFIVGFHFDLLAS